MRKILAIILTIFLLTACQQKDSTTALTEFYLTYNEIDIKLNTNFTNTYVVLGEYNDKFINELSEQNNFIYSYDEFEIETTIKDNVEKISTIYFTSDSLITNEGIKIGDSLNKMIEVYGNGYEVGNESIYTYRLNNTSIIFIMEDNKIISIQYNYL